MLMKLSAPETCVHDSNPTTKYKRREQGIRSDQKLWPASDLERYAAGTEVAAR
jgi:hypothetical protein